MPEEFSRTTKRKRITLPNGGQVDVPVITKISFIDPFDRYQETEFTIDNNESDRVVRVDQVPSSGDPGGPKLPVERIKKWKWHDVFERHQDAEMEMDNETGANSIPPHFSTHQKTHVVTYTSIHHDANIWIKSELIDEFVVVDPFERYQEKVYILSNNDAQADSSDADIAGGEAIDPPWRTDPYQNIIDWQDSPQTVTGDDRLRVSFLIETAVTWTTGTVGSPPNEEFYVQNGTTYIRHLISNPGGVGPPVNGLIWHGADEANWSNGNIGNSGLLSPDRPTPTWSSSVAGYTITMSTVSFTNGDSFTGGATDFGGVTAEWVPGLPPYNQGPPWDQHMIFIPESLVVDPFYPSGNIFVMTLVEEVTAT